MTTRYRMVITDLMGTLAQDPTRPLAIIERDVQTGEMAAALWSPSAALRIAFPERSPFSIAEAARFCPALTRVDEEGTLIQDAILTGHVRRTDRPDRYLGLLALHVELCDRLHSQGGNAT